MLFHTAHKILRVAGRYTALNALMLSASTYRITLFHKMSIFVRHYFPNICHFIYYFQSISNSNFIKLNIYYNIFFLCSVSSGYLMTAFELQTLSKDISRDGD